jgi:hypothetical protein
MSSTTKRVVTQLRMNNARNDAPANSPSRGQSLHRTSLSMMQSTTCVSLPPSPYTRRNKAYSTHMWICDRLVQASALCISTQSARMGRCKLPGIANTWLSDGFSCHLGCFGVVTGSPRLGRSRRLHPWTTKEGKRGGVTLSTRDLAPPYRHLTRLSVLPIFSGPRLFQPALSSVVSRSSMSPWTSWSGSVPWGHRSHTAHLRIQWLQCEHAAARSLLSRCIG